MIYRVCQIWTAAIGDVSCSSLADGVNLLVLQVLVFDRRRIPMTIA
jgi:hypothetical protein